MTVFVTGGAGFIGSELVHQLLARPGTRVVNIDKLTYAGNLESLDDLVDRDDHVFVQEDICDGPAMARLFDEHRPSAVYHLAAETGTGQSFDLPVRYNAVNVMGTAQLIEAIRAVAPSVRRVILAGSRSVYGEGACLDAAGRLTPAAELLPADMARGDFDPKDRHGNTLTPVPTNADCTVAPASIYAPTKLMQQCLLKSSVNE